MHIRLISRRITFLGRGTGKEDLGKALAFTDKAIKLDEKYAPAWAARVAAQNMMAEVGLTPPIPVC